MREQLFQLFTCVFGLSPLGFNVQHYFDDFLEVIRAVEFFVLALHHGELVYQPGFKVFTQRSDGLLESHFVEETLVVTLQKLFVEALIGVLFTVALVEISHIAEDSVVQDFGEHTLRVAALILQSLRENISNLIF